MKKILTIIVTYNASKWIDKCFSSLRNSEYPVEIIVVDNNSSDNTPELIKAKFPEVKLIENSQNLGFARANNLGIKYALEQGADYVFLLNQDAWIEQDTLKILIETFQIHSNVGLVSPIHLNGTYSGLDYGFANYMSWEFVSDTFVGKTKPLYSVYFVNAAAWMISKDCIRQVGGFDTSLFTHYGEDNNFCQRVKFHKFDVVVNTHCTICHDREQRPDNLSSYRVNAFTEDNERMMKKLELGNINKPFKFHYRLKYLKRELFKSIILMRFNRISSIRKDIELLFQINNSREKNMIGNLIWLND